MPDIRVVILAAGRGSRLREFGSERPKWLLEVGGRTIAERQLEAVALARIESPGSISSVTVVTGHAAGEIERFLSTREDEAEMLYNEQFAELNNWYSVLLALRAADGDQAGVVILNGDLFAEPAWIADFLVAAARTESDALIGVDTERQLTDESMKVSVTGTSPMILREVGKLDVTHPVGEYVGLAMARGSALAAFRGRLEAFVGSDDHRDEWYERAIALLAAEGLSWVLHPTPDSNWVEIDDQGDLDRAQGLATVS
ncbi:MAG: NTP transferase domain-containing protein [Solirubrobacterales bacterium]